MLTHFFRQEAEIVHDPLGQAVKMFAAQLLILRCNSGRAIVQMADTQVFTAQCHHRTCAKTKAVSTKNSALDHIKPGFQAAIHLQTNPVTQAVRNQCMVCLGQTGFPR